MQISIISQNAIKLREAAEKMQEKIDKKRNPATAKQNHTRRRAGIIEGMYQDALRLERLQQAMIAIAELQESRTERLVKYIDSKMMVAQIISGKPFEKLNDLLDFMDAGINGQADLDHVRSLIDKYVDHTMAASYAEIKRKELEHKIRGLVGVVPGYFPSTPEVIDILFGHIDHEEGDKWLEPEAGDGAIARAVREKFGVSPDVCEWNYTLREHLSNQGFNVIGSDTFEIETGSYNKVAMNPPFEDHQDAKHVQHVFDNLLAPGGTLVSVMAAGSLWSSDHKFETEWREWFYDNGGEVYDLPDGSFEKSGTMVNTVYVVMRK